MDVGQKVSWADRNTGHRMTGEFVSQDGGTITVRVGADTITIPASSVVRTGGRSLPAYKVGGKTTKRRLDRKMSGGKC